MRIRRSWALAAVMLLNPVAAGAHGHTADAFGAFSFVSASSLWGFRETYGVSWPRSNQDDVKHISVIGDLGLHFGSHDDNDVAQVTFTGGLRWQFARSREDKHVPFAQVLVGGMHSRGNAVRQTDPAIGVSAGYEYDLSQEGWAARLQFDYLHSGGDNFPGFSAGIVYRYKKSP